MRVVLDAGISTGISTRALRCGAFTCKVAAPIGKHLPASLRTAIRRPSTMKCFTRRALPARCSALDKLLFIDNYDSFTYNVVHLLNKAGAGIDVILNDDPRLTPDMLAAYPALVVGPGPGNPSQQPQMMGV